MIQQVKVDNVSQIKDKTKKIYDSIQRTSKMEENGKFNKIYFDTIPVKYSSYNSRTLRLGKQTTWKTENEYELVKTYTKH